MFSISFRNFHYDKKSCCCFTSIIKAINFARAIITSTACASSAFLSSYINIINNYNLLHEVFVISRIIKVEVGVISRNRTLNETM